MQDSDSSLPALCHLIVDKLINTCLYRAWLLVTLLPASCCPHTSLSQPSTVSFMSLGSAQLRKSCSCCSKLDNYMHMPFRMTRVLSSRLSKASGIPSQLRTFFRRALHPSWKPFRPSVSMPARSTAWRRPWIRCMLTGTALSSRSWSTRTLAPTLWVAQMTSRSACHLLTFVSLHA